MGNNKSKTVNITTEPSNKDEVVVGAGKVVGIEDSDHIKPQTNGNAGKENAETLKVRSTFTKLLKFLKLNFIISIRRKVR